LNREDDDLGPKLRKDPARQAGDSERTWYLSAFGTLIAEFTLSPFDLGVLSAVLFLAFGLIQLPLGAWLDRFGPRRVQAVLLSIAAIGAAVFASAQSFAGLIVARALIGLGVAGALMAGLKGIVLWFPADRIALANGWLITLGGLGAVTATVPAELLIASIGWRGLFLLLATLTAASALLILRVVPDRPARIETATAEAATSLHRLPGCPLLASPLPVVVTNRVG
jgi:MFS family permease